MPIPPRIATPLPRRHYCRAFYAATALGIAVLLTGAAGAAETGNPPAMFVPPASQSAVPPDAAAASGNSEIRNRIESTAGLAVAGERLHGALLRPFYQAHNFEPVWSNRQAQANALLAAVAKADEHGLAPDLFHMAILRNAAALSPVDRDLLLSDAFLSYADALARGAISIEERRNDEDLKPDPVDVPAVLDRAIASPDPAAVVEALAPQTPAYRGLQQALRAYRAGTVAEPAPRRPGLYQRPAYPAEAVRINESRIRAIEVNLERLRWLPHTLPSERVWVNTAPAELIFYRDDQPVFTTRVIVGQVDKQTPELQAEVSSLLFNPPWMVPRSILAKELGPRLTAEYMARHHMVWRQGGLLEQLPPSALGQLKFEMADRFDVYLHDTPEKHLFARADRRKSHGCVRVQNPRELAALMLQQPEEVINRGIALGYTNRRALPTPIPVFVVYQTAFLDTAGRVEFVPDVYQRDDEIWQDLQPRRQAPVVAHDQPAPRRG